MVNIVQYAPIVIMIIGFIFQHNIFVRPEKLEEKHRLILDDVRKEFASKDSVDDVKAELRDIKAKIDKIYDLVKDR